MTKFNRCFPFLFCFILSCHSCELSDNLVFDPHFYLNTHPDLEYAGLHTPEKAEEHWCTHGIKEGRQGISSFHTIQYLENYPDLLEMFGDDYEAAINHYVNTGNAEDMLGYAEGGGHKRWTVRSLQKVMDHYIYLSCSERTAGAVDSLVWRNKEFINNWDHGRQLQNAITVQNYGECWNPTEAGGASDGIGLETKSILTDIIAGENVLHTSVLPAYWVRGDAVTGHDAGQFCPTGQPSYNSEDTHPYEMKKTVTLGCFSLYNCIKFDITAALGDSLDLPVLDGFAQLEAPTAYLSGDFSAVSYLDTATGLLDSVDHVTKEETNELVIIHTKDNQFALGAISEPRNATSAGIPGLKYAYVNFNIQPFDRKTFKWSVVIREDLKPGGTFYVTSYLCVGDVEMVIECLMEAKKNMGQ